MNYIQQYLNEANRIIAELDMKVIERMVNMLVNLRRRNGRLFFFGVGGSAANCSHAVNDFRKIAGVEAYTPADNVSELTARTNDNGWDSVFVEWLRGSKLKHSDGIFILSVGGGNAGKNISVNLILALDYAKKIGAKIFGIVGRDGGYTAKVADACIVIPTVNTETITPHTESFQAVIWHLLVSHPGLKVSEMKWESVK
jgi:D-sedoheptulose 7-phosphate isomerase